MNNGDDSSDNEDNEAIVISENKKIQDVLRESQTSFMKKAQQAADKDKSNKSGTLSLKASDFPRPMINKRLGVGLAAVVKMKLEQ